MAEYYDRHDNSGGGFMMGLLTGAVIGAGIGLLLAPKRGSDLRNELTSRAGDLANTAAQAYRRATDKAADLAERGLEAGEDLYGKAKDVVSRTADQADRFARDAAANIPKAPDFNRG